MNKMKEFFGALHACIWLLFTRLADALFSLSGINAFQDKIPKTKKIQYFPDSFHPSHIH